MQSVALNTMVDAGEVSAAQEGHTTLPAVWLVDFVSKARWHA